MFDVKRFKAAMILADVTTKELASRENWSMNTAYRKVNGRSQWTVAEIVVCKELLNMSADAAEAIFFGQVVH